MDKYTQYKLKITDKNKELVKIYLQKIKKFVEKYNIEKELYNDIEEMVFEKLSNQKKLDQLSITRVLKEVGEPEVIFADYIFSSDNSPEKPNNLQGEKNTKKTNTKKDDDLPYYEKLIKDGWVRDNDNAIIYGISGTLAEKLNLPTWLINIFFIISIFVTLPIGGTGATIYLVLGFILPIKGFDYKGKNFWKIQFYHLFTDFFHNVSNFFKKTSNGTGEKKQTTTTIKKEINEETKTEDPLPKQIKTEDPLPKQTKTFFGKVFSFFAYVFTSIFNILIYILKIIMKYIVPILRFIIFAIISLTLFGLFIAFIALLAVSFSNLTFNNIDFTSFLPTYAKLGFLAGVISIGIFLVASIMYTFGYKTNKSVIIGGFIIFAAMLSLNILTSIWLFSTYGQINSYTQEAQIELDNNKDITFNTGLGFNEERIFPLNIGGSRINLESITGTTLKVEIKYKFFGNDYLENIFKDTIVKPELVKNGSTIEFENPSMFSEKIPYIPFEKRTIIYVPEGYTIKFSGHVPYITNTYVTFEDKKYKNNNHIGNCFDKKIWYSVEESRFICLANESETNSARKQYLINYVIENFDNISPITHENIYKRDYSYYSDITSDWNFRYFDWRDEDTLEIEFNDMSLNIQASLDIIETETGATILDFRINNIDVDEWNFDDKYYNNIETISEWVSISYGEGYSEVINNTSIENAVDYSEIINDTSIENAAEYSEIIHNISIEKIEKNEDGIITNAYIKTLSP